MQSTLLTHVLIGMALCGSTATTALAQASSDQTPQFHDEIVVTPERGDTPRRFVPAMIGVADGQSLLPYPAVQFSEILSFLPGFQIQQGQAFAAPPIVS